MSETYLRVWVGRPLMGGLRRRRYDLDSKGLSGIGYTGIQTTSGESGLRAERALRAPTHTPDADHAAVGRFHSVDIMARCDEISGRSIPCGNTPSFYLRGSTGGKKIGMMR